MIPSPGTLPDFSSTAWFFAKKLHSELNIPIGIINCSWAGTSIKPWMSRDALAASGEAVQPDNRIYPGRKEITDILKRNQNRQMKINTSAAENDFRNDPSCLFNGMVAPLTSFSIKGIIWYQGEDDASQASTYRRKFESLITDYRAKWGKKDLPFIFVQLSTYPFSSENKPVDLWVAMREAQITSLPHTGMVVSIDLGDPNNIHPRNKRAFGERLANEALKTAYGK